MSNTLYTPAIRVLACPNCGGPVTASAAGGQVACSYCKTQSQITPRNDAQDLASAKAGPPANEAVRFARLREQEKFPAPLPPTLDELVVGDLLPLQNIGPAFAAWQSAVAELRQGETTGFRGVNFSANERAFYLSLLLAEALRVQGQQAVKVRAIVETTCDLLSDAGHRQILYGVMSTVAASQGDHDGASGWLERCAAHSDDLRADTAYRYAFAYLFTCRGDPPSVLRVLGSEPGEVPIAPQFRLQVALLRCNALLVSGGVNRGLDQLITVTEQVPLAKLRLQHLFEQDAQLKLDRRLKKVLGREPSPYAPAAPTLVLLLLLDILGIATIIFLPEIRDIAAIAMVVVTGLVLFFAARTIARNRQWQRVVDRGHYCLAQLESVEGNSANVNEYSLVVFPTVGAAYEAKTTQSQTVINAKVFFPQAGMALVAKVDPSQPESVLI